MKKQLEKRLKGLKTEFEQGQKMLADLEFREAEVRDSLLRISGAIQVLEEELGMHERKEGGPLVEVVPDKGPTAVSEAEK